MDVATIVLIFKTLIGVLGIVGNCLVCVVIAKVPAMRTRTNAFIFNQAVIDLLGSLFVILQANVYPAALHQNKVIAIIECHVWQSTLFLWVFFVASTFNLVLLTLERYVAIVYPFKYPTYFGVRQAKIMLVGIWVFAIGYKVHIIVIVREIIDGACHFSSPSKAVSLAEGIITFLLEYAIPLFIMTFCYVQIILELKKASSSIHAEPSTSQQGENSMSGSLLRARRNTLKTLFIVFVSYTICWSPNQIAFFMFNFFGLQLNFEGAFYNISVILVQLNTCINPIIYSFKYKQFQKGLRDMLKPCFPKLVARYDEQTVSARTQVAAARPEPISHP